MAWCQGFPSLSGPLLRVSLSLGASLPGAARRGSAVGYFNERCQGLQRGEEAEGAAERSLAKLGLGRRGLARRCSSAAAARSSPAGTSAPFRIRSQRLFPALCPSFLSSSSSLCLPAFICARWGKGGDQGTEPVAGGFGLSRCRVPPHRIGSGGADPHVTPLNPHCAGS